SCSARLRLSEVDTEGRRAWAAEQDGDALEAFHEAIGQRLKPGAALDAAFADGRLSCSIDGVTVIDRIVEIEAEGRLLQRKFNDPRLDLGRGPVRQDRLLAADLLQRQLAAFVIEFLEAVE